nr:PBSX family phage terminase large subunit [Ligilactobacillus agilis]
MMERQINVDIQANVNPHFKAMWQTQKPYIIAKGGRGSFKSSVISLKLVLNVLKQVIDGHKANVICIRENASYLRDSVYNQILWAMDIYHVSDQFKTRVSPMQIIHKETGSTFYFYGADDPMKLKSNTVRDVINVWFEECANLKSPDVFDQALPTFIRQKSDYVDEVQTYFSYNPPKNPYDWVNEWVTDKETNPSWFVDTSTYLDDELGFTTKQQLDLIETYKKNDYDYYRWLYLGKVVGLGTNVYNIDNFHIVKKIADDEYLTDVYYSLDTGHEVSATTCGCYGLTNKGNVYLLDTYYYSPIGKTRKKAPSELSKAVKQFIDKNTNVYRMQPSKLIIDSAEGALDNQFYLDYNIHWTKVKKLKNIDMIDRVQDLMSQGRAYVLDTEDNQVFLDEHRKYQWDEKTLNSADPKVIKVEDHTVDAFKYLCRECERDFGLRY